MDTSFDITVGALVSILTCLTILSGVIGWMWSIRTLAVSTQEDLNRLKVERAAAILAADNRLDKIIAAADARLEKAIDAVMLSFRSDVERAGEKAASELKHFVEIQQVSNEQMVKHLEDCKIDHNMLLAAMNKISDKAPVR